MVRRWLLGLAGRIARALGFTPGENEDPKEMH
jgi:hypothetical protein